MTAVHSSSAVTYVAHTYIAGGYVAGIEAWHIRGHFYTHQWQAQRGTNGPACEAGLPRSPPRAPPALRPRLRRYGSHEALFTREVAEYSFYGYGAYQVARADSYEHTAVARAASNKKYEIRGTRY